VHEPWSINLSISFKKFWPVTNLQIVLWDPLSTKYGFNARMARFSHVKFERADIRANSWHAKSAILTCLLAACSARHRIASSSVHNKAPVSWAHYSLKRREPRTAVRRLVYFMHSMGFLFSVHASSACQIISLKGILMIGWLHFVLERFSVRLAAARNRACTWRAAIGRRGPFLWWQRILRLWTSPPPRSSHDWRQQQLSPRNRASTKRLPVWSAARLLAFAKA
jgi:hypothetical protein